MLEKIELILQRIQIQFTPTRRLSSAITAILIPQQSNVIMHQTLAAMPLSPI